MHLFGNFLDYIKEKKFELLKELERYSRYRYSSPKCTILKQQVFVKKNFNIYKKKRNMIISTQKKETLIDYNVMKKIVEIHRRKYN